MYSLFLDEVFQLLVLTSKNVHILDLLNQFFDLDLIGVTIELDSLEIFESSLREPYLNL